MTAPSSMHIDKKLDVLSMTSRLGVSGFELGAGHLDGCARKWGYIEKEIKPMV